MAVYLIIHILRSNGTDTAFHRTYLLRAEVATGSIGMQEKTKNNARGVIRLVTIF